MSNTIETEVKKLLDNAVESTVMGTQELLSQAISQTGQTLKSISENPLLKFVSDSLGADWLKTMLGQVDVEKVRSRVGQVQLKYPQETPRQLAHRLMVKKAWEAGKIGLITNVIPPMAAALLGIELVATMKLQADMVYEIAAAYGLDLQEPDRRGEVLAIFGLSMGGYLLKLGLSFVEIIPGIGPVVGASANALLLYSLGHAARQFYEAKYSESPINTETWQKENEEYFQSALSQSQIMDKIMMHMVLASYPYKSQSELLSELPSCLKQAGADLEKLQPLEELLEQLSPDFAVPLLAQCYRIARLDGIVTPAEQKIIDAIAQKFDLDVSF